MKETPQNSGPNISENRAAAQLEEIRVAGPEHVAPGLQAIRDAAFLNEQNDPKPEEKKRNPTPAPEPEAIPNKGPNPIWGGVEPNLKRTTPEESNKVTPRNPERVPPAVPETPNTPKPERPNTPRPPENRLELSEREEQEIDGALYLADQEGRLYSGNVSASEKEQIVSFQNKLGTEAGLTQEERRNFYELVTKAYSKDALYKAYELRTFQEKADELRSLAASNARANKTSPAVEQAKISDAKVRADRIDEEFFGKLKSLGVQLESDKRTTMRDALLKSGVSMEEVNAAIQDMELKGSTEKVGYQQSVMMLSLRESERNLNSKERALQLEAENKPNFWKKALGKWASLPMPARVAISSVVGFTAAATVAPGAVLASGMTAAGLLGYRMVRGLAGAAVSGVVQKKINEKFLASREQKAIDELRENVISEHEMDLSTQESLKKLAEQQKYQELTETTVMRGNRLSEQLREETGKIEKKYKYLKIGAAVGTGLVVGLGTGMAVDKLSEACGLTTMLGGAKIVPDKHVEAPKAWEMSSAKPGDSVWRVIEHDLQKNVAGFNEMSVEQKTYMIDYFKDRVVDDPGKFGLVDADHIKVGWGAKELQGLFDQETVEKVMGTSKGLSQSQLESIAESNRIMAQALHAQPEVVTNVTPAVEAIGPLPTVTDASMQMHMLEYGNSPVKGVYGTGAEEILRAAKQDPVYFDTHPEAQQTLKQIFADTAHNELVQDVPDPSALRLSVMELSKMHGLTHHDSQIYTDYIAQGGRISHESLGRYVTENGELNMPKLEGHMDYFQELTERTDLPRASLGSTVSRWEPRVIYVDGIKPELHLVRQFGQGFQYKNNLGVVHDASEISMKSMMINTASATPSIVMKPPMAA